MHVVYLTATTIVIFVFYVLTDEGEENKIGINFFTRIRVTLKPIDSTMNTKKGLREGGGRKRGESGVIPSTDISTFSTLTHQWALPRSFSTQSSEPPRFIPSFNPLARTQCFATLCELSKVCQNSGYLKYRYLNFFPLIMMQLSLLPILFINSLRSTKIRFRFLSLESNHF